jgi:hypothetical protein
MNLASIHKVSALLPPRILIHGQEGVGKTTLASKSDRRARQYRRGRRTYLA